MVLHMFTMKYWCRENALCGILHNESISTIPWVRVNGFIRLIQLAAFHKQPHFCFTRVAEPTLTWETAPKDA